MRAPGFNRVVRAGCAEEPSVDKTQVCDSGERTFQTGGRASAKAQRCKGGWSRLGIAEHIRGMGSH